MYATVNAAIAHGWGPGSATTAASPARSRIAASTTSTRMTANLAEPEAPDLRLQTDLHAGPDPPRDRARSGRPSDDAAAGGRDAAAMHTTTAALPAAARSRALGYGAFMAAAAFAVGAGIHVTHGTFDSELTGTVDYANDIARSGWSDVRRPPSRSPGSSTGPAGLALGHSPSWFAAVGIPGNLLWLAGLIGMGRATARSRALRGGRRTPYRSA